MYKARKNDDPAQENSKLDLQSPFCSMQAFNGLDDCSYFSKRELYLVDQFEH